MVKFRFKQLDSQIINKGGEMKTILLFLLLILFSSIGYSQVYPREQTLQAGEYFLNVDPGEGNGIPISTVYGLSSANANFNIQLEKGDVAYVRFQSSNGKWSSPRGIKYNYYDLVAAQYYIKLANGNPTQYRNMLITNEPTNSPFFLAVSNNIPALANNDTVFVRFQSSNYFWSQWSKESGAVVGISENDNNLPKVFKLYSAYPNPFNPSTTIKYDIPKAVNVNIQVFDFLGRKITTLVNENKNPGSYTVKFNADNLASGIYFYTINADDFISTNKIILLK